MKKRIPLIVITVMLTTVLFFTNCVTIPQETITLSQTLGSDIKTLHIAYRNMITIHFTQIKNDVTSFIDDVYAPFVIHYVLSKELAAYKEGKPSLYGTIELAGEQEGKEIAENAVTEMYNFQDAARRQIEKKRKELMDPIIAQETEVINAVNISYENALHANATITVYLQSAKKVKDTQKEVLSLIGLDGADEKITESLIKVSNEVSKALEMGKEIDVKSDDAYDQIQKITEQIKKLTNKE